MKDPLYESIQRIDDQIKRARKITEHDTQLSKHVLPIWVNRWVEDRDDLEKLRANSYGKLIDKQEIDDALFDLYERKCEAFRFRFPHRGDSLSFLFELTGEKVLLISVDLKDITPDQDPDDPEERQAHLFENLGFHYDDYKNSLVYQYDMTNFKSAWEIKMLLSRIIYDIGYFGQEKQGTIEFYG